MSTLAQLSGSSIWNRVADLPVKRFNGVSLHGRLLTIGGGNSNYKPTAAVHMYHPTTNSWEAISHITTPRALCLAAVLPDNRLMVVGGYTTGDKKCDSVEFGRVV